jgi:hypothetical protein
VCGRQCAGGDRPRGGEQKLDSDDFESGAIQPPGSPGTTQAESAEISTGTQHTDSGTEFFSPCWNIGSRRAGFGFILGPGQCLALNMPSSGMEPPGKADSAGPSHVRCKAVTAVHLAGFSDCF